MVISAAVLESLSGSLTSTQMRDAAVELAFRIAQGEYDDLDDTQRVDLQALAQILDAWSRRVAELETAIYPQGPAEQATRAKP